MTSSLELTTREALSEIETPDGIVAFDMALSKEELYAFIDTVHTRQNVEPTMYLYWGGKRCRVFHGILQEDTKNGWVNIDKN